MGPKSTGWCRNIMDSKGTEGIPFRITFVTHRTYNIISQENLHEARAELKLTIVNVEAVTSAIGLAREKSIVLLEYLNKVAKNGRRRLNRCWEVSVLSSIFFQT